MSELPPPPLNYAFPVYGRPGVIPWFKAYCVMMCLIYLLVAAMGVVLLLMEPNNLDTTAEELLTMGIVCISLGLGLMTVFLIPLLLRPRPWLWVYDLVLICLSLTSICFWPFAIPLLIFWIKPETKAFFQPALPGAMRV